MVIVLFDQDFVTRLPIVGVLEDFEDLGDAETVPDLAKCINELLPDRRKVAGAQVDVGSPVAVFDARV